MALEQTYVVEKPCPVCGKMTHVIKVRSRLITEKTDWDYCTWYKGFNPYMYMIWVCEHCGFAGDEKAFTAVLPDRYKKKLSDFVTKRHISFKFQEERGIPEAIASYKLAILFAEMTDASLAHQAGLYLKMAWIFRISGNKDEENANLLKAAELYEQSVMKERYPIGPMTDSMAIYLTGACYYMAGQPEQATQYVSRLMGDSALRTAEPKVFERARDLWQDIRGEQG